jgi:hypothetical protein
VVRLQTLILLKRNCWLIIQIFGPADLCFNALSMLIDIPSTIHDFHQAVDGMLEEVSSYLGQFVCMNHW